jgi:hypothetical protein
MSLPPTEREAVGGAQEVAKLRDLRRSDGTLPIKVGTEVGHRGDLLVIETESRSLGANLAAAHMTRKPRADR